LGGSFNPAHAGHREVAERARAALGLDEIWLLVSPGNPLKPIASMAPFPVRFSSAARIADGRRILAVALEHAWGTRFTRDTLRLLKRHFPRVHFVWLMGADVLAELPRWRRWEEVVRAFPFAVLPRPGFTCAALAGCAVRRYAFARVPRAAGRLLRWLHAPAWAFLPGPENSVSASAIREKTRGERAIGNLPPDDETWRTRRKPKPHRKAAAPPATGAVPVPAKGLRQKAAAAGPGRAGKARRRSAAAPNAIEVLQSAIVGSLQDDKAADIVTLDLVGRASFADRMVIATGLSDRQIATMARHLEERLKAAGLKRLAIEGRMGAEWVLVDAGDIVVHLFKPDARALYALERMWGDDLGPDEQVTAR